MALYHNQKSIETKPAYAMTFSTGITNFQGITNLTQIDRLSWVCERLVHEDSGNVRNLKSLIGMD